ncbi:MAG TPA: hypothetical protein VGV18_02780 [Verrucomicrobiae bacterium]|nr:hypothetical protein [Verrucomicrobiae bacterium]
MKTNPHLHIVIVTLCSLPWAFGQGSLTPGAFPGRTMLTLSQIEPGTR